MSKSARPDRMLYLSEAPLVNNICTPTGKGATLLGISVAQPPAESATHFTSPISPSFFALLIKP